MTISTRSPVTIRAFASGFAGHCLAACATARTEVQDLVEGAEWQEQHDELSRARNVMQDHDVHSIGYPCQPRGSPRGQLVELCLRLRRVTLRTGRIGTGAAGRLPALQSVPQDERQRDRRALRRS